MSDLGIDLDYIMGRYNYWLFCILMMTGLYITA